MHCSPAARRAKAQAGPIPPPVRPASQPKRRDPLPPSAFCSVRRKLTSKRAYRRFLPLAHAGNLRASAASDTLTGAAFACASQCSTLRAQAALREDEFAVKWWKAIAPAGLLGVGLVLASGVLAQQQPPRFPTRPRPSPPPLPGVSGTSLPDSAPKKRQPPQLLLRPRPRSHGTRTAANAPQPAACRRAAASPASHPARSRAPVRWRISLCRSTSSRFPSR